MTNKDGKKSLIAAIHEKITGRKFLAVLLIVLMLLMIAVGIAYDHHSRRQPVVLEVALYSGTSWNVPQKNAYIIYDRVAELFEQEYADLNVKIKFRSGQMIQNYSEWLAQQVLLGREADIFLVLEEDFSTYSSIGLFENLTPYIDGSDDFDKKAFYQRALQAGQYYGSQYTLPFLVAPTFMVANKTLLEQENIDINEEQWTWDDFYDVCEQVTRDLDDDGRPDQFGVYDYDWENAFYTNDVRLFPNDGSRIAFNDNFMGQTIEYMKNLHKLNQGIVVKETMFDRGQVAFKMFSLPEYRAYGTYPYRILKYENFEWEAVPMPAGPNEYRSSRLYTVQLGMSSRSQNKDLAFEFMKFISTNLQAQEMVWEETYALPVLRNVVEDIYKSDDPEVLENKAVNAEFITEAIETSYLDPHFKKFANLKSLMDQHIFQIIAGDLDVNTGIKALKDDLNRVISE
ncbi:MAG: multiple sugar transport system substrate-binding protein [Clostridiales bacterium]|jgi:multiple sugar transport system substrate-binding protein|nr:multiple sugar transport system substrate-binding protein [Clostridiales bacterium]